MHYYCLALHDDVTAWHCIDLQPCSACLQDEDDLAADVERTTGLLRKLARNIKFVRAFHLAAPPSRRLENLLQAAVARAPVATKVQLLFAAPRGHRDMPVERKQVVVRY